MTDILPHAAGQAAAILAAMPESASPPTKIAPLPSMWYFLVVSWSATPLLPTTEEAAIPTNLTQVIAAIHAIEHARDPFGAKVIQVIAVPARLAGKKSGAAMDVTEEVAVAMWSEWERDGGDARGESMPDFAWRHLPANFGAGRGGRG